MKKLRLTFIVVMMLLFCGISPALAQLGTNNSVLNPNQIGEADLKALPHMMDALAKSIMEKRPFLTMLDVDALVSGSLNDEQREMLYAKLFLPVNLNTASREEILLVPGVGPRMAHEFEEYRPYKALAQFRREMGKYVDKDEVARMEQFVFIPIDLNTASDEQILSIPGLGKRMLREFKEYRPYKNIEQFRREMGKYVDDNEVARLERYVVIN
ncbi:MAG: ComEA family DNA-binding protein [Rhodothermales bacterium]